MQIIQAGPVCTFADIAFKIGRADMSGIKAAHTGRPHALETRAVAACSNGHKITFTYRERWIE